MRNQTRKKGRQQSKPKPKIEHHHLLLRLETRHCPTEKEKRDAELLLEQIIRDIGMKHLDSARVYYVDSPKENAGTTGIMPIQTSHIAFHFWSEPERTILRHPESKCLLQFDLYTCGSLGRKQIAHVLSHLAKFQPAAAELTLLNRKTGLVIERHNRWVEGADGTWQAWLRKIRR